MTIKKFPLLVFDWDGTLVDSIERIVVSLQHASKHTTKKEVSDLQAKSVIGLSLNKAISTLHPELDKNRDKETIEKIADAYRHHYHHENKVPSPLFDGTKELLTALKNTGYTLAISTGKSRFGLQQSIEEHNVADYFSATRCANESKSKPHPQMLHEIFNELNFSNHQALMIGDSEHDLKMASNAEVKSIGITHGVHDAITLKKHNPIICLSNIAELSDYLNHNLA